MSSKNACFSHSCSSRCPNRDGWTKIVFVFPQVLLEESPVRRCELLQEDDGRDVSVSWRVEFGVSKDGALARFYFQTDS